MYMHPHVHTHSLWFVGSHMNMYVWVYITQVLQLQTDTTDSVFSKTVKIKEETQVYTAARTFFKNILLLITKY